MQVRSNEQSKADLLAESIIKIAERKVVNLKAILENESLSKEEKARQLLRLEAAAEYQRRINIF